MKSLVPSLWDLKPLKHNHYLLTFDDIDNAPFLPGEYLLATTDSLTLYCPLLCVNQKRVQAIIYSNSMTQQDVAQHLSQAVIERAGQAIPQFVSASPLFIFCQQHTLAQMIFYLQKHRHHHQKILLIGEVIQTLPFTLIPSQILLPENPIQPMVGSIQLLEDWSVCARFCGMQNAGYGDCTINQLFDQWPDMIQPTFPTNTLLSGDHAFIQSCKQKLSLTNNSLSLYTLEV